MENTETCIKNIVSELALNRAKKKELGKKIDLLFASDKEWMEIRSSIKTIKNDKNLREMEIIRKSGNESLIDQKKELVSEIKELKRTLSETLGVYLKETGKTTYNINGTEIIICSQYSLKSKQMSLFN